MITFVKNRVVGMGATIAMLSLAGCGGTDVSGSGDDTIWLTDKGLADAANVKAIEKGTVTFGEEPDGQLVEDTIASKEQHFYDFKGKKSGVIRIEMRAERSKVDASLALYLPSGKKVAKTAWQNADGKDAIVDRYTLPADGDYRLMATTYYYKSSGAYSLRLICEQGPCEPGIVEPWKPTLRSITLDQAKALTKTAADVRYATDATGSAGQALAWAWIQENCNRRADMVNFAFASVDQPSVLPKPIPESTLKALLANPSFDTAQIYVTGPLNIMQKYVLPDGSKTDWQGPTSWDHHIAAVINVEGELMVVDPSLSLEPVAIQTWIHSYILEDVDCPALDMDTYLATQWYYGGRWQFAIEKPAQLCGYTFMQAYGLRPEEPVERERITQELNDARDLLAANFEYLSNEINSLTHKNIPESSLGEIRSELQPLSDADTCAKVEYAYKWCQEHKP